MSESTTAKKRKANLTSFQKGQKSWNAQYLTATCKVCGAVFPVNKWRLDRGVATCSRPCAFEWLRKRGIADRVIALADEGKTPKQIAEILQRPLPTVYSHLNRRRYRFRQKGLSRAAVKTRFLKGKQCAICGWDRCLDAAHIIPASKGGTMEESNLLPLCPNHHRLFDAKTLTEEEATKVKDYIDARS